LSCECIECTFDLCLVELFYISQGKLDAALQEE